MSCQKVSKLSDTILMTPIVEMYIYTTVVKKAIHFPKPAVPKQSPAALVREQTSKHLASFAGTRTRF